MDTKTIEKSINTPAVHKLVRAYLLARTFYEVTKEKVDAVYAEIMEEIPVYSDAKHRVQRGGKVERIYDHEKLYLTDDDEACRRIWDEADKRLRAAGIKPDNMETDHCPALVARSELSKIQGALIDEAGKGMEITVDRLLSAGLDIYNKFIDLVVGATLANPKFKHPKL